MNRLPLGALVGACSAAALLTATALDLQLTTESRISFATLDLARAIITNRDDFLVALSPFDRAARMKTDRAVSEEEFARFLERAIREWSFEAEDKLAPTLRSVADNVTLWKLPLPPVVALVQTSGSEEGNACYTRQNAIVLPQPELRKPNTELRDILIHELFHVASRHSPELRRKLYAIIGFRQIQAVDYPPELSPRKITNPDGVQTSWSITVTNNSQSLLTVPMLYSSADRYDPQQGGEFFRYLTFKLLVVNQANGRWEPTFVGGQAQLLDPNQVSGFFEQIGRNTDYIIHPDEILASNFVLLVNGSTNVPSPHILDEMRTSLTNPSP